MKLQWEQFCVKKFATLYVEACVNILLIKRICISRIVDLSFPLKSIYIATHLHTTYYVQKLHAYVYLQICLCMCAFVYIMCVFLHQ